MSSLHFQRLKYLLSRLQCLLYIFKDFNVFCQDFNVFFTFSKTSMSFVKTSMSSSYFKDFNVFCQDFNVLFTFQRLQCLLSKDYNVFMYISKTSMSSVIYAFKRLQCLHWHFKDIHVFRLLHFTRLQRLLSFIELNVLVFVLHRTRRPLFVCFELKKKELQMSSTLQNFNVLMFSQFHFLGFC